MAERAIARDASVGLVDLLDRVLGGGVVAAGDIVLSVAGVELVYLNLRVLLASVQSVLGDPAAAQELEALGLAQPRREPAPSRRELPSSPPGSPVAIRPSREPRGTSPLDALERFARSLDRELGTQTRVDVEPERVEQGLARLVLTLVDILRRLMERQAMRRLEAGSLTNEEIERLGRTFLLLEHRMEELLDAFGLDESDLDLDLGLDVDDLG